MGAPSRKQRHAQQGVDAANPSVLLRLVQRIGPGVVNLDWAAFEGHATDERAGAWADSYLAFNPFIFRQLGISACPPIFIVWWTVDAGLIGIAQTGGGGATTV